VSLCASLFALGTEFDDLKGWHASVGNAKVENGVVTLISDPTKGYGELRTYMTVDVDQFPIVEISCLKGEYQLYLADIFMVKDEPEHLRIGNKVQKGKTRFYLQDLTPWKGRRNALLAIQTKEEIQIDHLRFIAQGESEARAYEPPAPPRYEVRRVDDPITIDGQLHEFSWRNCKPLQDLRLPDGQLSPLARTTAKMVWDDDHLYVLVQCEDKDLLATKDQRDADLWEEDVVELFLSVPNEPAFFVEFEVNPKGAMTDMFNLRPYHTVLDWDCRGWKSAVFVDGTVANRADTDKLWVVEMSIPLLSVHAQTYLPDTAAAKEKEWQARKVKNPDDPAIRFNFRPKPGDIWKGNLYRIDNEKDHWEYQAWSPPVTQSFHVPARFGEFLFSDKTVGR
jgi:hypothetical protein